MAAHDTRHAPDPFELDRLGALVPALAIELERAYRVTRPMPAPTGQTLPAIPPEGLGASALPELWRLIVDRSAHLASPWMSGHMDTAPHPAAALTQALVAALNNNLLFRELSPLASEAEERLIEFFTSALELGDGWHGVFASGGSVANLTALFAAVGGYEDVPEREHCHVLVPASAHLSLFKSASVLGIPADRAHRIECDEAGRVDLPHLEATLRLLPRRARSVVVSVLGTTIHGSVDDVAAVGSICERFGAWHHVDAIYGAALCVSIEHRRCLHGLARADSIALGPQKWMYVPRVSALVLVRGEQRFDRALATSLPYSLGSRPHRGRWGLQGSRPADGLVLWTVLQVMGTQQLGRWVDRSIALAREFNARLGQSSQLLPTHHPDLNIQVMRTRTPDSTGARMVAIQERLNDHGRTWLSVSRWRDEALLRAVLLSPSLTSGHVEQMVADVEEACR